eukprot:TRINITY_DN15968_c0_g1_i1.p1 TRINITY_DN15968_c0_g1~~TRINITY_DN15968_c0_g1_i1.p1  ORF type:complete len:150 (+),score=33.95 TRINITY_DN15968_c0_g1_i1:80-529(+)
MAKRSREDEGGPEGLGLGLGFNSGGSCLSMEASPACNSIKDSNIGYQLLKKCGWKEGTGLGIAEQGILSPIETHVKNDKRGIGAERKRRKLSAEVSSSTSGVPEREDKESGKKIKKLSKRIRKLQEEEKRIKEREFEIEFSRLFWPENV